MKNNNVLAAVIIGVSIVIGCIILGNYIYHAAEQLGFMIPK